MPPTVWQPWAPSGHRRDTLLPPQPMPDRAPAARQPISRGLRCAARFTAADQPRKSKGRPVSLVS